MSYYAIDQTDSNEELKHFKYLKRYRGKNGEWQYVYEKPKPNTTPKSTSIKIKKSSDAGNSKGSIKALRNKVTKEDSKTSKDRVSSAAKTGGNNATKKYIANKSNTSAKLTGNAAASGAKVSNSKLVKEKTTAATNESKRASNRTAQPLKTGATLNIKAKEYVKDVIYPNRKKGATTSKNGGAKKKSSGVDSKKQSRASAGKRYADKVIAEAKKQRSSNTLHTVNDETPVTSRNTNRRSNTNVNTDAKKLSTKKRQARSMRISDVDLGYKGY